MIPAGRRTLFGQRYLDANVMQKVAFHAVRLLCCGWIFHFVNDCVHYSSAVLEFDDGPFTIMLSTYKAGIFDYVSEMGRGLPPPQPATGSWRSRLLNKFLLVVFGLPLIIRNRRKTRAWLDRFNGLARRGAFVRTYI